MATKGKGKKNEEKSMRELPLLQSFSQLKLSGTVLTCRQKSLRKKLDQFPFSLRLG
jgi:hypothetical protein